MNRAEGNCRFCRQLSPQPPPSIEISRLATPLPPELYSFYLQFLHFLSFQVSDIQVETMNVERLYVVL